MPSSNIGGGSGWRTNAQRLILRDCKFPLEYNKLDCKLDGEITMQEIGLFEAKNKLSALVDRVEHGAEIVITRRGKPVAKLVPAAPGFDREKAKRAAEGLRETSKGLRLRGLKIKDLINEGRR